MNFAYTRLYCQRRPLPGRLPKQRCFSRATSTTKVVFAAIASAPRLKHVLDFGSPFRHRYLCARAGNQIEFDKMPMVITHSTKRVNRFLRGGVSTSSMVVHQEKKKKKKEERTDASVALNKSESPETQLIKTRYHLGICDGRFVLWFNVAILA